MGECCVATYPFLIPLNNLIIIGFVACMQVIDRPPPPMTPDCHPMWFSSTWLNVNTLSLDANRIVVEAQEEPLIELYEKLGLKCIKIPFRNAYSLGGGVHCYTCDIRRKGELQSYFQ